MTDAIRFLLIIVPLLAGVLLVTTRAGCWAIGHAPPDVGVWVRQLENGYRCARCRRFIPWGGR